MEEARLDFLKRSGWDYAKLEDEGIISPVLSVSCDYKKTTTYPDTISIDVAVKEFKGVKLFLSYVMKNEEGTVVCTGTSSHCFLNAEGRPISMKKDYPEFFETLNDLIDKESK